MAQRILIINIFGIGDVLFTTPMIRNLHENFPDAFIGYVCNKRALKVLETNPHLNKLHVYEKDDFRTLSRESRLKALKEFKRFLARIKQQHYDMVFDLSLNKYSSFFLWLLGIKQRVGFNYKNRSPFLTKKVTISGYNGKPVIEHYLDLLRLQGLRINTHQMEVFITEDDRRLAEELLQRHGTRPDEPFVALIPGGGASWGADARYRRWPAQNYARLADKIIEKYGLKIILMGDLSEKALAEQVISAMKHRPVNLIGKTALGTYLALLSRSTFAVLNDGGPLHMAVAAGAKTVSLIGPVDEHVYGPYPKGGHYVVTKDICCRPCYRSFRRADCEHIQCVHGVSVEEFFTKVQEMVASRSLQKGGIQ